MKYVVLGRIDGKWADDPESRIREVNEKLKKLNIDLLSVFFTQGEIDFVEIVQAPSPDAMLSLSLWFVNRGYGRLTSMPAFDMTELDAAFAKASGGA